MEAPRETIGFVVGGSLKGGLRVRLSIPPQAVQEGAFVVTASGAYLFYGLVTDIRLEATDPRFAGERLDDRVPDHLAAMLQGNTLYSELQVHLQLMLERGPEEGTPEWERYREELEAGLRERPHPTPPKTVPSHHVPVYLAGAGDIAEIFGREDEPGHFVVGYTREQGHPVCLDLRKFVQRSAGVFGATGTGKSFLTRILLSGIIRQNVASVLVFDMHNEYAYDDIASDTKQRVAGLRSLFPTKVRVVGLGEGLVRGQSPDFHLQIAAQDIHPDDILLLTRELNLRETTPTVLDALWKSFGPTWFLRFREMRPGAKKTIEEDGRVKKIPADDSVEAWAEEAGVHAGAAAALHSKLRRLFDKPYIVEQPAHDTVQEIVDTLAAGGHVILSFGKYETDLDYLLVTNLLTRRIREAWEKRTDDYRSGKEDEPRPLVIVVEEAHKLLDPEMASQTIFSTIARELRKYYVTLLIIDQRPSQIYDEVMSQLGTRISGWLGDERDIQAVLSGLAGREQLRGLLSRLQPKEEVLLLGWGVPMALPVRTRRYDETFYQLIRRETGLDREKTRRILGLDD